jgi:hypothetical protein
MRPTWLVLGAIVALGAVAYVKVRSDAAPEHATTGAGAAAPAPSRETPSPALQREQPAPPAAAATPAAEPGPAEARAVEILGEMAAAESRGDAARLADLTETLRREAWDTPSARAFAVRAGMALVQEARGLEGLERVRRLDRARRLLSRGVYDPSLFDERGAPRPERARLVEASQQANQLVMRYGPGLPGVTEPYEVPPGVAPVQIVSRGQLPYGHNALLHWNHGGDLDPARLRAGERLLLPKEELRVEVHLRLHLLGVFLGDWFVKEFAVGVGAKDTPTPVGRFTVADKHENPDWWSKKDGLIPYGDPRNELGAAWIPIVNDEHPTSYGIHGTNRPDTVGSDCSQGCVRLRNEDVRELFYWVRRKTAGGPATVVEIR